jgi:hypothetical protein
MPSRRIFLLAAGGATVLPRFAWSQARRMALVALFPGDEEDDHPAAQPFFDELRRRGWVEGTNIDYERLYGRGARDYMEGLAKSAASRAPDVIYASTAAIALAVLKETDSVPLVFNSASDPVDCGFATRGPGGTFVCCDHPPPPGSTRSWPPCGPRSPTGRPWGPADVPRCCDGGVGKSPQIRTNWLRR